MIPRFSPDYHWSDLTVAIRQSRENSVSSLENRFAHLSHHQSAIAFRYGRSGLYFLLKALGAKNKKVVLPAYTCVVMANAVVLSGNKPVFLDNAADSLQPDPLDYLKAIDADTIMVVPTHLFGIAEETSFLYSEVKKAHPNVFVLQDCAHSYFCKDSTGNVVTSYGDGALFGMNISKLVNSVYGGMLTLRDSNIATKVKNEFISANQSRDSFAELKSRSYAASATFAFTSPGYKMVSWVSKNTQLLDSETRYFDEDVIELPNDFSAPMLPFEAEMGHRSLDRYDRRIQNRREIASYYLQCLKELKNAYIPFSAPGNTWSHFPILVPSEIRNSLKAELEKKFRVEIGIIIDYSIPSLPSYRELDSSKFPNSEMAVNQILNLPLTFEEGIWPIHRWKQVAAGLCEKITQSCHNIKGGKLKT